MTMENQPLMNLCKYIALAGITARRKALLLIKDGQIFVNNHVVTNPSYKVTPQDIIKYNDQILKPEKKVYVLLNKPKNYITTVSDEQGRATVLDLIQARNLPRIFPVGRLDRNTTGLLLLTNDGELAQKLAHPRNSTNKAYNLTLDRPLEAIDLDKLHLGISLPDGHIKPDKVYLVPGSKKYELVIELHSGKNRIVRRMLEFLGYKICSLDRFKFAGFTKQGLARSKWRFLKPLEIDRLIKNMGHLSKTTK